jgi:hypothetical protein
LFNNFLPRLRRPHRHSAETPPRQAAAWCHATVNFLNHVARSETYRFVVSKISQTTHAGIPAYQIWQQGVLGLFPKAEQYGTKDYEARVGDSRNDDAQCNR